jgi:HSP20 family protein
MRFDPFKDIARFEPFHGVEDFFNGIQWKPTLRGFEAEPRIKMDVTETENAYNVKAEIPGVSKEDIQVSVEGNQVSISAEIKKESEEKKGASVVRSERFYGVQSRSFTLAQEIDDSKTEAKYQNGILELTLPKKSKGSSKRIEVN